MHEYRQRNGRRFEESYQLPSTRIGFLFHRLNRNLRHSSIRGDICLLLPPPPPPLPFTGTVTKKDGNTAPGLSAPGNYTADKNLSCPARYAKSGAQLPHPPRNQSPCRWSARQRGCGCETKEECTQLDVLHFGAHIIYKWNYYL